ncbi:hypothetical protein [Peribacillus kribbensis]|uniref:hypothetical protein n=1 Tax=Peribacillus kribbensis TaxID=356658 RepID=UPI00047E0584|nr:hypothetical protein [Peribacillus kribbensis]
MERKLKASTIIFLLPLLFLFFSSNASAAVRFMGSDLREKRQEFEQRWNHPYFRFVLRLVTGVWGTALLMDGISVPFWCLNYRFLRFSLYPQFFYGYLE